MDHLDEVPGTHRTAVQVAPFCRAIALCPSGSARNFADAGCKRLEDRFEPVYRLVGAADHQAVAAFQSPDTAARADIAVVNPGRCEGSRAVNVVDVIRV